MLTMVSVSQYKKYILPLFVWLLLITHDQNYYHQGYTLQYTLDRDVKRYTLYKTYHIKLSITLSLSTTPYTHFKPILAPPFSETGRYSWTAYPIDLILFWHFLFVILSNFGKKKLKKCDGNPPSRQILETK